jgi:predicted Zn-dependent peptidase
MNKVKILGAKENLFYEKLKNGLEIYMVPNSNVKNFYLTLNTKFGSIYTNFKYEGKNYNIPKGVAHYLEHLMFNMPDGSAFNYFSKLGSNVNAYTSYDITCYEVFSNSYFKENLEYLIKYVYTPYFTKEMINDERGIITEEIKMYEDNPNTELLYGLYRNIYVNDEHQYLISGTVEDVKKIKLEDIEIAYKAFYNPANMFMILTGNFNPEEALAIIHESLSKLELPEYQKPEILISEEPYDVKKEYNEKEMNVDKPKVTIGFKIPKNNFKSLKMSDIYLKVYINLLMRINFGTTSLLREELETNNIINDDIGFTLTETDDYYVEAFMVSTDYPDYVISKIKDKINNLDISKESLDRKVKSTISSLIMEFDEIEGVSNDIQDDVINYNRYIYDAYNYYRSLNVEDAIKIANKLKKYKECISILNPKKEKSA